MTLLRNDDPGKSGRDGNHSSLCGGGWLDSNDKDVQVESCGWSAVDIRSPAMGFRCARGGRGLAVAPAILVAIYILFRPGRIAP